MDGYRSDTYGEEIADIYDELHSRADTQAAVSVLASLAGTGRVMELAVGTGRVAIPLAATGLEVHGVDSSPAMLDQLRAKPGGDAVQAQLGDMAELNSRLRFDLVFVVFNSFFLLDSQDAQVCCFEAVARHLNPGGRFVLECFVPEPAMYQGGQRVSAPSVALDGVRLDAARLSKSTQTVETQHVLIRRSGIRFLPVRIRYAWPTELDLMARIAGLHLENRWAGWAREPYGDAASGHISVYRS